MRGGNLRCIIKRCKKGPSVPADGGGVSPLAACVEGRQRCKSARANANNFKINITTIPDRLHKFLAFDSSR